MPRKYASLGLALIILLGFGIRLAGLYWGQGYCTIGPSDALEAYSVAVDYGVGEARAQYLGQPNYNSHAKLPGPLWTLFCVAGLRLSGTVEGVILGIILLNTAAIYLTYLLAERILGPPASRWAALFAATLPFSVYYSVSVYNPNVMQFLGGLLFLALWDVIRRERARGVFWLGFLLLVMPQFHMCVTMLLPALALILLLAAPRLNLPWLLAGLLSGALLYVPYLLGEFNHGWQNTRGIMMPGQSGYDWGGLKALTVSLSVLTNWVPQWTASVAEYRQLGRACFGWLGIFLALNLLSGLIAVLLVGRALLDIRTAMSGFWRAPRAVFNRSPELLFLAILVGVPLLCAAVSGKNFRTHYALVLFPALLALAGGAAAKWTLAPRLGRWVTTGLVLLACCNVWFMPAMFHAQSVRIARGDAFVGSFRKLESVYQQLKVSASAHRGVRVDDGAYLRGFSPQEQNHLDAKFIRPYVAIREKECGPRTAEPSAPVTFRLCRSEEVRPDDTRVAYWAHGIALMSVGND
jgi:4-amino-4-deoxy-L-arabinose transferase-like glycosyltransferase